MECWLLGELQVHSTVQPFCRYIRDSSCPEKLPRPVCAEEDYHKKFEKLPKEQFIKKPLKLKEKVTSALLYVLQRFGSSEPDIATEGQELQSRGCCERAKRYQQLGWKKSKPTKDSRRS